MGLSTILDNGNAVCRGDLADRVEIGSPAVQVHGYDRAGPSRDRGLDASGVERPGRRVRVHEHRHRSRRLDADDGRDARVRCRYDLVAALDAHRLQGDRDRVGAVRDSDGGVGPAPRRERRLKRFELASEGVAAARKRPVERSTELRGNRLGLSAEVTERNDRYQ